jgi:uncharacterized membrane protein
MKNQIKIFNSGANAFTMHFNNPELEKQFHQHYSTNYLWVLRIAHILAVLLFIIASIADYLLLEIPQISFIFRLAIAIPVFLIGFVLTFIKTDFYKKTYQWSNLLYVLITGFGFILSGFVAADVYKNHIYSGLIICLIFNYTFIRQSFVKSSLAGAILLIIYFILAYAPSQHYVHIDHISIYLLITNTLGMFIAYSIEFDGRKSFLMLSQIEKDKLKIENANKNLEKKVEERTEELQKRNTELVLYKDHLELLVKERTDDLETTNEELAASLEEHRALNDELKEANEELEKFNKLFIGREKRIHELKTKIKELEYRIDNNLD